MKLRALRVWLALGLSAALQAPVLAQVRPVLMPSLAVLPSAPVPAIVSGAALPTFAPALPAALAAPSLAAFSAPVAAAAAAAPAFAPALARAAAPLPVPAEVAAEAPALAGFDAGRRTFDGAAASGQAPAAPVAAGRAAAPAPAPRGDFVEFNGAKLPTRMFSDQTKISKNLIRALDATKKTLDIAIYELAIREVRDALMRAKKRGVKVRILMDQRHVYPEKESDRRTEEIQSLIAAGFEMKTLRGADAHGLMHNKFALCDGALLETGSYNWSRAADDENYEDAVFDAAAARIASYQRYYEWMWSRALPVVRGRRPAATELDENGHTAPLPPAPQDQARVVDFNGVKLPRESFSPHGTVADLVAAIDAAGKTLLLANFSFTHEELIDALLRAKERRVAIRVVFDRTQYGYMREMAVLRTLGFDVRLSNGKDGRRGVMHAKFAVLDGKLVETGSFNWTFNGELNNYENALFLDAPDDAAAWTSFFERIWKKGRAPTDADHLDRDERRRPAPPPPPRTKRGKSKRPRRR